MNSLYFDFAECSFSEKIMTCKDKKDGLSREGSSRVSIYKATGIVHSYTLECNYQTGRRINHLAKRLNKLTGAIENDPNPPSSIQKVSYTVEIFEDVGRSMAIAFLDYIDKNPISRIPLS